MTDTDRLTTPERRPEDLDAAKAEAVLSPEASFDLLVRTALKKAAR